LPVTLFASPSGNDKTQLTSGQHENIIKTALYKRCGNSWSISLVFVITYDDFTLLVFLRAQVKKFTVPLGE
jgi:hypothetical protein